MKLIPKDSLVSEIENLLDKGKYHEEYDCAYRDGNNDALYTLKEKIDTLEVKEVQKEPAKDRFTFKAIPRLLEMIEPTDRAKTYTAKLADTLDVEGYSTDAKIVREKINVMNGEKVAMATMDEEPVNEVLEEAAEHLSKIYAGEGSVDPKREGFAFYIGFKNGSKWQQAKDQETIELAEDHAMLAGMEKMREQMMKDAVGGYVIEDIEEGNGDFLLSADYIPASMGLKDRQKVKVIILKDE